LGHKSQNIHRRPTGPIVKQPAVQISQEMSFVSPALPPQVLEQYNRIIPTFAEDFHKETFKEANHRRSCNSWIIKGGTIRAFTGQLCAIGIAGGALYAAYQLGMAGHEIAASVIGGFDILGIVSVFLGQSYLRSKKAENKHPNDEPQEDSDPD
jgi:uncharacterized membrane protein